MAAADTTTITYDLSSYAHLEEWREQPELYLDRYFSRHYFANPIAGKRKHSEVDGKVAGAGDEMTAEASESVDSAAASSETLPREWECVSLSPNKLCVIGVAQQHPLLDPARREDAGKITRVTFTDGVRKSIIKGKGKKTSLRVMPDTKLCTIYTDKDKEFVIRAAVKGLLVEWNSRLEDDPLLIDRHPEQGFIAIIKPPTDDDSRILSSCVDSV